MEPKDNNKITGSEYELRGLYILSAPLLDEKQVVKFGMSECLQNRIKTYVPYYKTPYYMACYKLADKYTKNEIVAIEAEILNITCQYKTDDFTSEYRRMEFSVLHDIVCNYLNKNEIPHTIFIKPIWKCFDKKKGIKPKHVIIKKEINEYDDILRRIKQLENGTKQLENEFKNSTRQIENGIKNLKKGIKKYDNYI